MSDEVKILYRYIDGWILDDMEYVRPYLRQYTVIKETECGWWFMIPYSSKKKWVSKSGRKRFAYPTRELALNSYIIRKRRQIAHGEWTVKKAKRFLDVATEMQDGKSDLCTWCAGDGMMWRDDFTKSCRFCNGTGKKLEEVE